MKYLLLILYTVTLLNGNEIQTKFINNHLVNISDIDNTIKVDLVNADKSKNIFSENFYNSFNQCYLQKEIAFKLKKAQKNLKSLYPNYSLLMMDCTRPRNISWKMYNKLKDTLFEKYVANPKTGSMHNYGAAVDIAIVDDKNNILDFGILPFYKGKIRVIFDYIKYKVLGLSDKQKNNQLLLKNIMEGTGFKSIKLEWWHFNGFSKNEIRNRYKIIE